MRQKGFSKIKFVMNITKSIWYSYNYLLFYK